MSNEIKRRVLLASVLKPVDDTRMFEKIGATLADEGYEVFIIGYPSNNQAVARGITILPLPGFNRISFKRLLIPWVIFRKINQVKPETVIINTPELLFVTVLNAWLNRRKVVYDVLENYYRTIRFTNTYPRIMRTFLAGIVRSTEVIFSRFVNQFLLAEQGYAAELKFVRQPLIVENKLPRKIAEQYGTSKHGPRYNLLFSGTLAPTTGVFEAIQLAKNFHKFDAQYTLTIIGYAALPEVEQRILLEIDGLDFIKLIGGNKLVAHSKILEAVSRAGTGIIIYPSNPATESSIPTKLYEYLALHLPIVISHNEPSHELVNNYHAGVVFNRDVAAVHQALNSDTFTFDCEDSIYWDSQTGALLAALKR